MKTITRQLALVIMCLLCTTVYAQKVVHGQRFRALIIGIDGMKGTQFYQRVFQEGQAPALKTIADHGEYSTCLTVQDEHCARTHLGHRFGPSYLWLTSSGWAAVLAGVDTNKHLVKDNDFENQRVFYQSTKNAPTFLYQLKQHGFITAAGGVGSFLSSNNVSENETSLSPGILDYECGVDEQHQSSNVLADATQSCNANYRHSLNGDDPARDEKLTQWMETLINDNGATSADLIMGVYDTVDHAGHLYGFDSNPNYLQAISTIDTDIARVIAILQKRALRYNEAWLVIVTSDHGGHHNGHDVVYFEDEVVPFVAGTFARHLSLAHRGAIDENSIRQMDVKPSVLHWFDVTPIETDGVVRSQYVIN